MKKKLVFLLMLFIAFMLSSINVLAVGYPGESIETCELYSKVYSKWDLSCLFKTKFMVYPETKASASYYCPSIDTENNKITCDLRTSDFYVNGPRVLEDPQGIGVWDISNQLFSKLKNVPNKCKGTFTLSNTQCNMGNCYAGCGNTGACPFGSAPSSTYSFTGKVVNNECRFDEEIVWNNPCCFNSFTGKPPSVSGSLEFYYEETTPTPTPTPEPVPEPTPSPTPIPIIISPVCNWSPLTWSNCFKNFFSWIGGLFKF